ncbi:TraB/GumN family protein [Aliidiomarina minuta]|uniref:TraB/GumN family protein n=1 Tax=Aliidiomarina minuta TaxID=880057 RepID=A0A432W453_9GAMM|nr:TraB/GumN family protein [Aliidiomarina minuta]RUO24049.1 TraB/GumN family protein [Aliidiomarina minuta]
MMNRLIKLATSMMMLLVLSAGPAQASLLWKVSGNELTQPSYLFGTIHVICEDRFIMNDAIEDAFEQSETLVMELDISAPGTMQRLQALMVNEEGPYLDRYLSEEQLETIDAYFRENLGAGVAQLGGLKPMALNSMVMIGGLPCADTTSYEVYFMEQADEQEIPIVALEDVDFQMGLFDEIPLQEQVDWLWEMISDSETGEALMESMVQAYAEQDLDALMEIMMDDPQFNHYMEMFIDERNRNWVAPLREQMHESSAFIAVGAGHLPGDQGLVNLLREAGYEVEAIAQ